MKLFGRKAAGRGAVRPVLARSLYGAVAVGEWPRSYEAQVREAYLGNPVAQRAVKLVAESAGGAPLAGDAALVALVGARSAGQPLLETVAAHLLLHGNAYVQILHDAGGRPGELFALRPERVSIEPDASGWPAAYLYRVGERVIRGIANVVHVGSAGYRKLVSTGNTVSGWVSETAARPETDTPDFAEIAPPMGELYANPAASQAMLDDAVFDVESWLADEIALEFAKAEGAAFVSGNGTNKPRGFLAGTITNEVDGVRAFGSIQYVASGAASTFAASNPQDRFLDLIQSLRSPYRQGACFVMNAGTLSAIRKFKTADGAFLWAPSLSEGRPDTLLGYPIVEAADMPDIAAGAYAVAFGNFKAGYLIAERSETQILRDPFTNKPFVHFYATKRVGGAVTNSEAIKVMKIAVS